MKMGSTPGPEIPSNYQIDGEEITVEILTREDPKKLSLKDIACELIINSICMIGVSEKLKPDYEVITHALKKRNQDLYDELGLRDWRED